MIKEQVRHNVWESRCTGRVVGKDERELRPCGESTIETRKKSGDTLCYGYDTGRGACIMYGG